MLLFSFANIAIASSFAIDLVTTFFFVDSHKFIYGFDHMVLNLMNLMICSVEE